MSFDRVVAFRTGVARVETADHRRSSWFVVVKTILKKSNAK
jgi:hypothetical protein